MAEKLSVVIRKDPNNPKRCFVKEEFEAQRGSTVTFEFPGEPNAEIEFPGNSPLDSPFDTRMFPLPAGVARMKVRQDAELGSFGYLIRWPGDGSGNGGGVVIGA